MKYDRSRNEELMKVGGYEVAKGTTECTESLILVRHEADSTRHKGGGAPGIV